MTPEQLETIQRLVRENNEYGIMEISELEKLLSSEGLNVDILYGRLRPMIPRRKIDPDEEPPFTIISGYIFLENTNKDKKKLFQSTDTVDYIIEILEEYGRPEDEGKEKEISISLLDRILCNKYNFELSEIKVRGREKAAVVTYPLKTLIEHSGKDRLSEYKGKVSFRTKINTKKRVKITRRLRNTTTTDDNQGKVEIHPRVDINIDMRKIAGLPPQKKNPFEDILKKKVNKN